MGSLDNIVGGVLGAQPGRKAVKARKPAAAPVKETTRTTSKDKFFGGRTTKQTTIRRKGKKVQIREKVIDTSPTGRRKTRTVVSGDRI